MCGTGRDNPQAFIFALLQCWRLLPFIRITANPNRPLIPLLPIFLQYQLLPPLKTYILRKHKHSQDLRASVLTGKSTMPRTTVVLLASQVPRTIASQTLSSLIDSMLVSQSSPQLAYSPFFLTTFFGSQASGQPTSNYCRDLQ